jgi:hypothetical protein
MDRVVFGLPVDSLWLIRLEMFWKYSEILYNIPKPSLYAVHRNLSSVSQEMKRALCTQCLLFLRINVHCIVLYFVVELNVMVFGKHAELFTLSHTVLQNFIQNGHWPCYFSVPLCLLQNTFCFIWLKIVVKRIWIITHISYSGYVVWF